MSDHTYAQIDSRGYPLAGSPDGSRGYRPARCPNSILTQNELIQTLPETARLDHSARHCAEQNDQGLS